MASAITGKISYHGGVAGTVDLDKEEKVLAIYAVDHSGGGSVQIDGGDAIPLVADVPFVDRNDSRTVEWIGVSIVFTGTDSYFVKTLKKQ